MKSRRNTLTTLIALTGVLSIVLAGCGGGTAGQAIPPITVSPSSAPDGIVGQAYNVTVTVNGGKPPFTLTEVTSPAAFPGGMGAAGTPCAGLALDLPTGKVSGTPVSAGNCAFSIKATDSSSPAQSVTLSLTIRITAPLAISTTVLPNSTDDVAYSATVATTGGLSPLSFSVSAGTLPAGLGLNATTGVVSGSPTTGGSFTFTVQVKDSLNPAQTVTKQYTILVLEISTTSLPAGTAGTAYSQMLAATGGSGNLTWALASGTLPAGLNVSAAGVIGGTPTAAGNFNFTVQATDSGSPQRADVAQLSLQINTQLIIVTDTLPAGSQNTPYSYTLAAGGGTGNLTWSIDSGTPPPGLSLGTNGELSGTPTAAGAFSFTVRVTDSGTPQQTATQVLTLTVNPPGAIGPTGGSVVSADGHARVDIPPNALNQLVNITITPAQNAPAGNLGAAYDFGPDGTQFLLPVTITIFYDPAGLPAGTDESNLRLALLENGAWTLVVNSTVDTDANKVFGTTSHFSAYSMIFIPRPTASKGCIEPNWVNKFAQNTGTLIMKVLGEGFVGNPAQGTTTSDILWNGTSLKLPPNQVKFVYSVELSATLDSSLLLSPGVAMVQVQGPQIAPRNGAQFPFTITDANTQGVLDRVSTLPGCAGGNFESGINIRAIGISGNGNVVVFNTAATNLDSNGAGLFAANLNSRDLKRVEARDLLTGQFVSFNAPVIPTDDGQWVAVLTQAALTPDVTQSNFNIYLVPTCVPDPAGVPIVCTGTPERITVQENGSDIPGCCGIGFSMSRNDRFMAFTTGADELYVRDRIAHTTTNICELIGQSGCAVHSSAPAIANSGDSIVFLSSLALDANDPDSLADVYLFNRTGGIVSVTRVSRGAVRDPAVETDIFNGPVISDDGLYVAYVSNYSDLVPNDNNHSFDVFFSSASGNPTRISLTPQGGEIATGGSGRISMSGNGRYVSFFATDVGFTPGALAGIGEVIVADTCAAGPAGCAPVRFLMSRRADGTFANNLSRGAVLSRDGKWIAFSSLANNLIGGDFEGIEDVFRGQTGLP